jgi:hypothetical protein
MSEEKKADLKACPFCGESAVIVSWNEDNECNLRGGGMMVPIYSRRTYYQPKCSKCECKLNNGWTSAAQAALEWNTRPREQELVGVLREAREALIQHALGGCEGERDHAGCGKEGAELPANEFCGPCKSQAAISQITAALKEGR